MPSGHSYPDADGIQRLALVDVETSELVELGRFRHRRPGAVGDVRWLTADTIHESEGMVS